MRSRNAVLLAFLAFFAAASGVIAGLVQIYLRDLPQIKFLEEYRPNASTRIYDRQGRLVGELYTERRQPVSLSRINPLFVKAIVAVEDERFFDHVGVDLQAIARALWADFRAQSFAQGGSTITQQLTRNLFLESDKSVRRKIKEAVLAVQIENHYTKPEILELYCNQIYLGSGVYGVEAASQKYFGRQASELTLPQAALIAGLPKAPSFYDPLKYPDRARQRRGIVLRRMLANRIITPADCLEAQEAPLGLVESAVSNRAPYFVEYVRQYLEEKYGYAAIYQKGLAVHTTLDVELQAAAESSLRSGLEKLDKEAGWRPLQDESALAPVNEKLALEDIVPGLLFTAAVTEVTPKTLLVRAGTVSGSVKAKADSFPRLASFSGRFKASQTVLVRVDGQAPFSEPLTLLLEQKPLIQGALLAVDPRTGHILAMVGGYSFAASQFNRAVQAKRQPGSGIKPFIYAAAIESGLTPAYVILDAPVKYLDPARKDYWEPQNYDQEFHGDTTLVEALTTSRNVVTIKLLDHLGVNLVTRFIRRMGVTSPMEPNLSLALGTSEMSLMELTSAYAVFADGGIHCLPMGITRVLDDQGRVLEVHEPEYSRVLDPDVAYVTLDMMRSVVTHGTGQIAKRLGFPVAAKTGTTDNYQDAWFLGFSSGLAAGVWVGYDDNRSMGRGATGGRYAGPIWTDFMEMAQQVSSGDEFRPSERIVFREIDIATGLLAGPRCPSTRLVAFIKGSEPKRICDHGGGEGREGGLW